MSFARLVYYSAMIGGWSAFLGWMLAEYQFGGGGGFLADAGIATFIGAAIGAGLNAVAGLSNGQWKRLVLRAVPGLVLGGLGGAIGVVFGKILFETFDLPRALGWMMMGLGIGAVEGISDHSKQKLRNGLIGGAIGGILGGYLFDPIANLIHSETGMTSRAFAFTILGVCIGLLIGIAQVVLKQAWLTVLDGYRPGRQLVLSQPVTFLGRGDHLALPFMGQHNIDLNVEHVKISRQPNGTYTVEDNQSKQGTLLNNRAVQTPTILNDGDTVKFGQNFVRFNWRGKSEALANTPSAPVIVPAVPPPPILLARSPSPQSTKEIPTPAVGNQPHAVPIIAVPPPPAAPAWRTAQPATSAPSVPPPPISKTNIPPIPKPPPAPPINGTPSSSTPRIPPPPPLPKR